MLDSEREDPGTDEQGGEGFTIEGGSSTISYQPPYILDTSYTLPTVLVSPSILPSFSFDVGL